MKMQKLLVAGILSLGALPILCSAQDYDQGYRSAPSGSYAGSFRESARVTAVSPRFVRVNVPKEECRTAVERQETSRSSSSGTSTAGVLVGGLVGGLLGGQVGGGSGKVVAAAAGAVGGAMVGNHLATNSDRDYPSDVTEREVRRCRTVDRVEERSDGFDVTYEYQGHSFSTRMHDSPGRSIPITVAVSPR